MTIFKLSKSGFGDSCYLIKHVSVYHTQVFRTRAGMKFLPGDVGLMTDVLCEASGNPCVVIYPHVNEQVVIERAKAFEPQLRELLSSMGQKKVITVMFAEKGPREITVKDFSVYGPALEVQTEAFIFQTTDSAGGFPHIYIMGEEQRKGAHKDFFPVFAMTSHELSDPVGESTEVGKAFTFMLYNSYRHGAFIPEVPELKSIEFPTKGGFTIPDIYKTTALYKFGDSVYSKEAIEKSGLTPAPEEEAEEKPQKESKVTEEKPMPGSPQQLRQYVAKQLKDGFPLSLFDIFQVGIGDTISMVETPSKIVNINLDMTGFARKACIYEGRLHYVPFNKNDDPEDLFGASGDLFQMHLTEETYPTK